MEPVESLPFGTRNITRTSERANHVLRFIGVDGEGITHKGKHEYILLSVGSESFHKNGEPLTFLEICEFLWSQYLENRDAVFVGFFLSYDYTMWFRNLPENVAFMLLNTRGIAKRQRKMGKNPIPFPVRYGGWEFDLHADKRFKLRPEGSNDPWLYVNDAGSFFQTSFLSAIDPKDWPEPICTSYEYEIIRQGKAERQSASFSPEMMIYNVLENEVLARVMTKLNEGFVKMGVHLKRNQWYGPGQCAQAWLNLIYAPSRADAEVDIPRQVLEAARDSYFGGWFEIMAHGHIGGLTYEYDINSAYPAVIAELPCFAHGEWIHSKQYLPKKSSLLCLTYVRLTGKNGNRIGVAPHRTETGVILRPGSTQGWFWKSEIDAAINAGAIDNVQVIECYYFKPSCDHKPFAEIRYLYEQRRIAGKNSPYGKALKLVYNSVYGKLAQSIGEPRYSNPLYASLVTSGCRVKIWDAIASHPVGMDAVTMVATDGVFFTSPHPGLPLSDKLGDWSEAVRSNLCQFMPGLYWDDAVRLDKKKGKVRSRGVSAVDLRNMVEELDYKWSRGSTFLTNSINGNTWGNLRELFTEEQWKDTEDWLIWPKIEVPISFGLITAKLAMHRGKWSQAGFISTKPRSLSGNPSDKRDPVSAGLVNGVIWTLPYDEPPGGVKSHPYGERFGYELRTTFTEDDVVTPSGHVEDEIYEWLHRS